MKKIVKYFILTLFILGLFISCTDDYLDINPINKLPEAEFWKTDNDALQALNASYDILQWMYARDWNSAYLVKTLPSDESRAGGGDAGDQPPYQEMDLFTFSSSNPAITATYQSNYYGIYRANKVIDNVVDTNNLRKRVIAEAKCLRAYYYFELVTLFGDVPLILHELPLGQYSQPRTKKADVYKRISADLRAAIAILPIKSEYPEADKFRVSKGTAQALLGKSYLYQEKWDSAAFFLDQVIQSNEYDLAPDYSKLFLKEQENGIESLLEVVYSATEGYTWGTFQWEGSRAMENNVNWQLMGPRGDYFKGGKSGLIGGWGFNYPSKSLYYAFETTDTIRRKATLINEKELVAAGGSWIGQSSWGYDSCFRIKYGTIASETDLSSWVTPELNYGTNLRLIRYADVLLMAAEAYYRLGGPVNETRALFELNKVRIRAKLNTISPSGTALFDAIIKERQVELAFECVRYPDLIRWGKASEILGPRGFVTGKHELLPIPLSEMNNNKNIGDNNPNY